VCGVRPEDPIEKAKSLLLSDHNQDAARLSTMSALIRHRAQPPYDPVTLAKVADEIDQQDYFLEHTEPSTGLLPCRNCGLLFSPKDEETMCGKCSSPWRETFLLCDECKRAFPSSTIACEACGRRLERERVLWTRKLGREMGMAVRRLAADPRQVWKEETYVGQRIRKLSHEQLSSAALEVEIFVMYESSLVLRNVVRSQEFNLKAVRAMFALYEQGWTLGGLDQTSANGLAVHSARRFDEYDRVSEAFDRDIQCLAYAAYRNAFGTEMERDVRLVFEWNAALALFHRSLEERLVSVVFGR
jgi:hypothetical protein